MLSPSVSTLGKQKSLLGRGGNRYSYLWFVVRVVLDLKKYDHISEGLRSLKWLNVRDTLSLNDAVMGHKCLRGELPSYQCRLTIGQRIFSYDISRY
jgi:hypothetical protein